MPPLLIPFIAAGLNAIGVTGGAIALGGAAAGYSALTGTIATVLAYTATTAATLGASFLLAQPKKQKGDPQQVAVKQSLPARTRSYGKVKVAGSYAFHEVYYGALYQIHVHGQGPWSSINEWWLQDQNAAVSGGVVGVLPWGSNVTVESHLGATDQAASSSMLSAFGGSGVWTSDHRLRGLAYTVLRLGWVPEKFVTKVYPSGVPALRVVADTSLLYDPRTATTAFSETPALCVRDFLAHESGFAIPPELIDTDSFIAKANIDEQAVTLSAGGTEPRYRVGFTYDLTQEPREVLRTLLQSCDGEIYPTPDGKVGIRGGAWEEPTVTIDETQIVSFKYSQGNDRLAAFNKLKLTFANREADYQPVEIDPWEDLDSQADIGVLQQDMTLQQVPSWTQARRLGKIFSAKANPRHRLTIRTHLSGVIALGERCVRVRLEELEIDEVFYVEKFELSGDLSGCDLTLASLSEEAYEWDPDTEEGTPPTPPPDSTVAAVAPEPTSLTLALVHAQPSPGVWTVQVRATVAAIPDSPWSTLGRYRKVDDPAWIDMSADGDWATISGVLEDGSLYEVQAAHAGTGGINSGNISTWTDSVLVAAVADPAQVNLLQHSDDPDDWVTPVRVDVTSGSLVTDPLGGTAARSLAFGADSGRIYAQANIAGTLSGRMFTVSVYVRSTTKSKIVVAANTDTQFLLQDISLSGTWQRVTQTLTCAPGDSIVRLALENRTAAGASNPAAGVVEVFGGMIQENSVATTYRSTP